MNERLYQFAQVYDMFMDNVDYPAWSKYLIQLLKEYRGGRRTGASIWLRNGKHDRAAHKKGYDMVGVDNSEDMLRGCQ